MPAFSLYWMIVAVTRMKRSLLHPLLIALLCALAAAACAPKGPAAKPADGARPRPKASQKPYSVLGQRYEPLATHVGFTQSGIASWYGKDFHGKATSNGEKYDMFALTAAHKTLPLGVYVRVKHEDSGKEIIVRVNDRGPFVKGRVIDLSYAAAKKLGIDAAGTGPVAIEALGYRTIGASGRETYTPLPSYDAGTFTVQVGAFSEYGNASLLSEKLRRLFGFSDVRMATVNGAVFYRVYAGKYASLSAAESAEKNFETHGYPGSFTVSLD